MNNSEIIIINYGIGNHGSLLNMLRKIGAPVKISANIHEIATAEKLILPGIGSFDSGMRKMQESGLISLLNTKVIKEQTPILGICLGLQLFSKSSEEGNVKGLGWLDAQTVRFSFPFTIKLKIPHMGWDSISVKKEHPVFLDADPKAMYYFIHSFHVICNRQEDILSTSIYGNEFVSSVAKDNIIGVQFHPEKSHRYGMNILKNFAMM